VSDFVVDSFFSA